MDDPIAWLTKFITNGKDAPDEKTRVMSKEQKEYYAVYSFLGGEQGLEMKFYKEMAELDMRLMMSYQGRRSDDVVTALSRIKEDEAENVGIQPIKQHFAKRRSEGEGTG